VPAARVPLPTEKAFVTGLSRSIFRYEFANHPPGRTAPLIGGAREGQRSALQMSPVCTPETSEDGLKKKPRYASLSLSRNLDGHPWVQAGA